MTVRIAQKVGMHKIVDAAIKSGVVTKMEPVLAMALGAGETTPFKLVGAYAQFANGGRRIEPHLIEEVQDRWGKTIWRADQRACPHCDDPYAGQESPHIPPQGTPVIDPVTAYAITLMLQGVVQRGTGAAVSSLGYPLAGKTGTTNAFRSAWFVGYSPNLIAGVFIGFDDNRSLGEGETGAHAAVPVFIDFMREALKGEPKTNFKAPKDAKMIQVGGNMEAFLPGTEPQPNAPRPASTDAEPGLPPPPGVDIAGKPPTGAPAAGAPPRPPAAPKKADAEMQGLF